MSLVKCSKGSTTEHRSRRSGGLIGYCERRAGDPSPATRRPTVGLMVVVDDSNRGKSRFCELLRQTRLGWNTVLLRYLFTKASLWSITMVGLSYLSMIHLTIYCWGHLPNAHTCRDSEFRFRSCYFRLNFVIQTLNIQPERFRISSFRSSICVISSCSELH